MAGSGWSWWTRAWPWPRRGQQPTGATNDEENSADVWTWTEDEIREWDLWMWERAQAKLEDGKGCCESPSIPAKTTAECDSQQNKRRKVADEAAGTLADEPACKGDGKEDASVAEKEVSFARRPPPKRDVPYSKWKSIKSAFEDKISLFVDYPSKYQEPGSYKVISACLWVCGASYEQGVVDYNTSAQEPFWKECQVGFKTHSKALAKGEIGYYDVAVKLAKRFAKNLPAV